MHRSLARVIAVPLLALLGSLWLDVPVVQAQDKPSGRTGGVGAGEGVRVRATVVGIDKDTSTVTLKGPKGRTVGIEVRDPQKLDAIKLGDPVIATYVEAVTVKVQKAGTATPGASVQESRVSSKPGETPAGAIGREITVTTAVTGIDRKAQTVTLKGPRGHSETINVKDPKHLEGVKVGDMVEFTYVQALALTLDKAPAAKAKSDAPKSDAAKTDPAKGEKPKN